MAGLCTSRVCKPPKLFSGEAAWLGVQAEGIKGMYKGTRSEGLGAEVKKRILMGTYALSAGYIDAFYKRALQVRNGLLPGRSLVG